MNFLKIYSKFSRLSYTSIRAFAGTRESINNPSSTASKIPKSTGIGGEKRNTASDTLKGEAPYHTGHVDPLSERGTSCGTSTGETITNRGSTLDTAAGVGKNEKGKPEVPPTGLSGSTGTGARADAGPGSGAGVGGKTSSTESINEGPGTSRPPRSS